MGSMLRMREFLIALEQASGKSGYKMSAKHILRPTYYSLRNQTECESVTWGTITNLFKASELPERQFKELLMEFIDLG